MKKILALLLLLGCVAIGTAAVSSWRLGSLDERYTVLVKQRMPRVTQLICSHRQ
jgi:ABC-type enterochelin transport system permease subunit